MTTATRPNKATALSRLQLLILGVQKHFPNGQLTIGNTAFTPASLIEILQGLESAMEKQNAARQGASDALTALRDAQSHANPAIKGMRDLLVVMFGGASQTLADFGLSPRKVRQPLTVEQKATAKAKAKATRLARGTKGPKAKLAIKGAPPAQTTAAQSLAQPLPAALAASPPKPAG